MLPKYGKFFGLQVLDPKETTVQILLHRSPAHKKWLIPKQSRVSHNNAEKCILSVPKAVGLGTDREPKEETG